MNSLELKEELSIVLRKLRWGMLWHGSIALFLSIFLGGVVLGTEVWTRDCYVMLSCAIALCVESLICGVRAWRAHL